MDSYLDNMILHWCSFKKMEKYYADERIKIEEEIQLHLQSHNQWKSVGTLDLGLLKIRSTPRRKWNQSKLVQIKNENNLSGLQFPFIIEYKEMRLQTDYLADNDPTLWRKLQRALKIMPTKPYFVLAEKNTQ